MMYKQQLYKQSNMQSTVQSTVRTMFCKICRDAGRDDYTSHNVRGPGGKLTCKFLAQIECRNCGGKGHTAGYCSVKVKKATVERVKISRVQNKTGGLSVVVVLNPFHALGMCDEVEDESDTEVATDNELSSSTGDDDREYDEEDAENARNCEVDFSTIPLTWGKMPSSFNA